MSPLEGANLALRFVLELCTLAALAYAGSVIFFPLAIILPLAGALTWAAFVAPRARKRLDDPARLGVEVIYFASGVVALAAVGLVVPAVVLAVADITHIGAMLGLKQR